MPTEVRPRENGFAVRGVVRITSGDTRFSVDFQEERAVVEFPSFSVLLRLKSEADSLRASISRLPPLTPALGGARPRALLGLPEFRLTVRGRSVGKLDFQGGGVRFYLTPFDFITRRMT